MSEDFIFEVDHEKATGRCYYCGCKITEENSSLEHVLHNGLGGRLKSTKILCFDHNQLLNNEVDIEFLRRFEIIVQGLIIPKERKTNPSQVSVRDPFTGEEKNLCAGKVKPKRPFYDTENNIIYASTLKNGEIYRSRAKQINEQAEKAEIKTEKYDNHEGYMGVSCPIEIDQNDPVIRKGLVKIAAGFASINGISREDMPEILAQKIGFNTVFSIAKNLYNFYVEDISTWDIYPLHILQLITRDNGELICRIELFSTFSFDILLNRSFKKDPINIDYIYSVREKIHIPIENFLKLYNSDIETSKEDYILKRFDFLDFDMKIKTGQIKSPLEQERICILQDEIALNFAADYLEADKSSLFIFPTRHVVPKEIRDKIKKEVLDRISKPKKE